MNYVSGLLVVGLGMVLGAILGTQHSSAQQTTIPAMRAVVVAACGTPPWTYTAGTEQPLTMKTTGELCHLP